MKIAASEVKRRGVSIFEELLNENSEVILNVKGKDKFCVIPFEEYEKYKIYKLEEAYHEIIKDIKKGEYHNDINRHFKTIETAIKND